MSKRGSFVSRKSLQVTDPEEVKKALQNQAEWNFFQATSDFSSITILDLRGQLLVSVPHLLKCSNLQHLDMSHNALSRLYPNTLPSRLISLNLSHNKIQSLAKEQSQLNISSCLAKKPFLRELNLSHNRITRIGAVGKELSGLVVLKADHNLLAGKLAGFEGMTCLREAWLGHNQVESASDLEPLYECSKLQILDLSENPLIGNGRSLSEAIDKIGNRGMTVCRLQANLDLGGVFQEVTNREGSQAKILNTCLAVEETEPMDACLGEPMYSYSPPATPQDQDVEDQHKQTQLSQMSKATIGNPFGCEISNQVRNRERLKPMKISCTEVSKPKMFRISSKENFTDAKQGKSGGIKSSGGFKSTNATSLSKNKDEINAKVTPFTVTKKNQNQAISFTNNTVEPSTNLVSSSNCQINKRFGTLSIPKLEISSVSTSNQRNESMVPGTAIKSQAKLSKSPVMLCSESSIQFDPKLLGEKESAEISSILDLLQNDVLYQKKSIELSQRKLKPSNRFSLVKITR